MSPAWRASPPELVAAFSTFVPNDPRVEPRKMFGYPCAFVGGNMFMGLYQDGMVLRLPEAARVEFLRLDGAAPFVPMPGRAMKEYVVVPPALLRARAKLTKWVARSFEYAAGLPAKAAKATKARPAKRRTR